MSVTPRQVEIIHLPLDILHGTFPSIQYIPELATHPSLETMMDVQNTQMFGDWSKILDIRHYQPDEVTLKMEGVSVIVNGRHHAENEYGYESNEFHRRYVLPDHIDPKSLKSKITVQGILILEASKKKSEDSQLAEEPTRESKEIKFDNKKAIVQVDVTGYKLDEISVKIDGNELMISGRKETKENKEGVHEYYHLEFDRHFVLPKDVDLNTIGSTLSKDGKLTVEVQRNPALQPKQQIVAISCEEDKEKNENEMSQ